MITAGHHSCRKATGIEIGVQAGTPLFHEFDMESDDTDPDDLDVPAPVTENVAPAPVDACDEQVSAIEYMTPGPDVTYTAPAPVTQHVAITCLMTPMQHLHQ